MLMEKCVLNPLDDCSSTLIITHLGWGAAELWLIFWGIWVEISLFVDGYIVG